MLNIKFPIAIVVLLLASVATTGCTSENGASGTSDGTSAESFELRSKDNLAPAMSSLQGNEVDSTAVDTAMMNSGE